MRVFVILAIVSVAVSMPVQSSGSSWTSGPNKFSGWSTSQLKSLCGTILEPLPAEIADYTVAKDLPESFDAREAWPACTHPVRDQGKCGSCWAHGASEAFTDRLCIHSNASVNVILSPEQLVSCDKIVDMGCNGGTLYPTWMYMATVGLVSDSCFPYSAGSGTAPKCSTTCADGQPHTTHKVELTSVHHHPSEAAMQTALLQGPIEVAFSVYDDFINYTSGIYSRSPDAKFLGGHAVSLVGYGVENGEKYWTVQNSWTADWGEKGYFRIRRGTNECGIEVSGISGLPKLDSNVNEDSKLCVECKKAADAVVSKLINLVFQGTVIGGCGELCGHLDKPTEQKICDALCVLAGEAAFETAIQAVQLNPENLCYDLKVCKH